MTENCRCAVPAKPVPSFTRASGLTRASFERKFIAASGNILNRSFTLFTAFPTFEGGIHAFDLSVRRDCQAEIRARLVAQGPGPERHRWGAPGGERYLPGDRGRDRADRRAHARH